MGQPSPVQGPLSIFVTSNSAQIPSGKPMTENPETPSALPEIDAPPYGWALVAALAVGALYALTLAPTTAFWDTSEYIATGHILGIPHPPGNPLFVLLARAWSILLAPLGLSVAVRVNLFSALMGAVAHGFWFLVAYRFLSHFKQGRRFALIGAAAAVLVSATAFTVWNQSNVNEKVYTVSLATIALLSWLAVHWRENLGKGKDDNLLILMVFILALSVGNHLMAFLAAPAVGIYVLMVHPRTLMNWRLVPAGVVALVLGLSVHLFLPIRSELSPVINEAEPTCETVGSALTSIVTYGQGGCENLSAALNREQYDKPPLLPRQAPLSSQFLKYFQYFNWQWARSLSGDRPLFPGSRLPFTLLIVALGLLGARQHLRRDGPSFWYMAVLFGTLSVALVLYLNFKYGYSIPELPNELDRHEVRERDYFFIVSFSVWGLWAGMGIAELWRRVADGIRRGGAAPRWSAASPVLLIAFLPLILNFTYADRSEDFAARDWAYNLLMSVEPYGVLFTNGDNDTFPLWYLQEAEGIRRDVTVIVTSYLNTPWYVRQLRELTRPCEPGEDPAAAPDRILCQRPYVPGDNRAVFTHDPESLAGTDRVALELAEPITPPSGGIITLDDQTIDQVSASYVPLDEGRSFQLGPVRADLPAGTYLYPWHQFALSVVNNAIGDRPVYFSSTTNAGRTLGLTPYLVREGLAFRLSEGPPQTLEEPGVVAMDASALTTVVGMWLAEERTRTLLEEVFVHRTGIPDEWEFWPDRATLGIPNYYAWAYYALAQAAIQEGDDEALARYQERADAWVRLGS